MTKLFKLMFYVNPEKRICDGYDEAELKRLKGVENIDASIERQI